MTTICLNMIVKNEKKVLARCLASVRPFIDYWVIADTGSSDGTQAEIRSCLQEIPGILYERPWVDFAHNRNEVLKASQNKGDYILLIDADETLSLISPLNKSQLFQDYYLIKMAGQTSEFLKMFLIKNDPDWSWRGAIHELLANPHPISGEIFANGTMRYDEESGFRAQDPNKFLKDATLLEKALQEAPDHPRTLFYLAQSYLHAKQFSLALKYYEKRVLLKGDPQEVFWSYYCIGCLQEDLGLSPDKIIASYSKAFQCNPTQAEPLYRLALYLKKNPFFSYLLTKYASEVPFPKSAVRLQSWIYDDLPMKCAEYSLLSGRFAK